MFILIIMLIVIIIIIITIIIITIMINITDKIVINVITSDIFVIVIAPSLNRCLTVITRFYGCDERQVRCASKSKTRRVPNGT